MVNYPKAIKLSCYVLEFSRTLHIFFILITSSADHLSRISLYFLLFQFIMNSSNFQVSLVTKVVWAHLEYKKNQKKWIMRRKESSISVSETTTFVIYGHTFIYIYIYCLKFSVREWAVEELRIKVCHLIS